MNDKTTTEDLIAIFIGAVILGGLAVIVATMVGAMLIPCALIWLFWWPSRLITRFRK